MNNLLPKFNAITRESTHRQWSVSCSLDGAESSRVKHDRVHVQTQQSDTRSITCIVVPRDDPVPVTIVSPYDAVTNPSPLSRINTSSSTSKHLNDCGSTSKLFRAAMLSRSSSNVVSVTFENEFTTDTLDVYFKKPNSVSSIETRFLRPLEIFSPVMSKSSNSSCSSSRLAKKETNDDGIHLVYGDSNHHLWNNTMESVLVAAAADVAASSRTFSGRNPASIHVKISNGPYNDNIELYLYDNVKSDGQHHQVLSPGSTFDFVFRARKDYRPHTFLLKDRRSSRMMQLNIVGPSTAESQKQYSIVFTPSQLTTSFMMSRKISSSTIRSIDDDHHHHDHADNKTFLNVSIF